jgi:diguanylate cyclase (GGDEF)-like protein
LRRLCWILGGILLVLAVTWVDFASAEELHLFPLYFFPIALVTLKVDRWAGVVLSLLAAVGWEISNYWVNLATIPTVIHFVNGLVIAVTFLTISLLLSEIRRRLEWEKTLSRSDALTGVANGRLFFERAAEEIDRSRRYGHPLSVAFIDLDDFKRVNDELGHAAGDDLLRRAAEAIRDAVRASDLVARIGGDEFAVLFVETGVEAVEAGEKLRRAVSSAMNSGGWAVTASVGVVSFVDPPERVDDLLRAADELMYEAKDRGKNAAVCRKIVAGSALARKPAS